jgi:glycosyltransferase involved in cell wall biosynthesis
MTEASPAMRLLILNPDLPVFPGRAGHEYLHATRLSRLGHRIGVVSLLHDAEQAGRRDSLTREGVALYLWQNPDLVRPAPRVPATARTTVRRVARALIRRLRAGLLAPIDTLVRDDQLATIAAPLSAALADEPWHAAVVVQSSCAGWLGALPPHLATVLVLHDVRALVYERQARTADSRLERFRAGLEAARYRHFERRQCRAADLVVAVSTADAAWVRRHYAPPRLATVPIPVDAAYFAPQPEVPEAEARMLFTGMMSHPPNVDAACYFARQIFPQVRAALPRAEFWIVGRDPDPAVTALAAQPGVVVTGYVDDIRPHLAAATVVVVPLRFGSGMRNKILEAWSMERCVVSTTIGAEGLSYADGEDLLVADDDRAFAACTMTALTDPAARSRIRRRGRAIACTRHDPDTLAAGYAREVTGVLASRRGRPMRVLVDLRWMHPGVAGGIENMSRSFVARLLALDRYNHYRLLVPATVRFDFDLRANLNVDVIAADGFSRDWRLALRRAAAMAASRTGWAGRDVTALRELRSLRAHAADVVLSTSGYISADLFALPNVLVVHDLQHEYHPEFFAPAALDERRRVFGESIRRAARLVAVSEYTRQTVIEKLGVDPSRISTVHEAADPMFEPANRPPVDAGATLARHGLTSRGYLFFPANTWPHKNHRAAFEALRYLETRHGLRIDLACSGAAKEAHEPLRRLAGELGVADRVRFLGYCPGEEMPALYEGAAALVYPSLFEGFGIPLVEAMWCGCPIVASDATSLPEIGGDAALFVDARRGPGLADAIHRVLTDDALRHDLVRRGRARAPRFGWTTFTTSLVRILRDTHESRLEAQHTSS